MQLYNKIKWILGILMIFSLILTTNLVDKNNFLQISNAVESIYEDRLVVKDLILRMSNLMHRKEIAAITEDTLFYERDNTDINTEIETSLIAYEKTELTVDEREILNAFKVNFEKLKEREKEYIDSDFQDKTRLTALFNSIDGNLDKLAKIQLKEGGRQLEISKRAMNSANLFTQIEIYILIILAILIQLVLIYQPKEG